MWTFLLLGPGVACGGDNSGPKPRPSPASQNSPRSASGWAYAETATRFAPADRPVQIVLELERPTAGALDLVVAIGGAQGPQIARWTFDHRGPKGTLAPASDPEPLLRVRPDDPPHPALKDFRPDFVAPRNRRNTHTGLAASPRELVQDLRAAATTVHDEDAPMPQRVQALAQAFRGVDPVLAVEQDGLHRVLHELLQLPTGATPTLEPEGERRARARYPGFTLALQKKTGGWVVSAVDTAQPPSRDPEAEPSPTAPLR